MRSRKFVCILVFVLTGTCASVLWGSGQQDQSTVSQEQSSSSEAVAEVAPRTLAAIHQDLRRLERATAHAKTDEQKSLNIVSLCALFVEIGEHPDLPESATLQSLSVRLRARLAGIERRTINELKKRKLPEPESMIADRRRFQQSRLASQRRRTSPPPYDSSGSSDSESTSGSESSGVIESNASIDTDKPGRSHGNAAPGGLPDYGWILVDLIRKTIRPDYWSVAGGPGKVIYYGPARALVVHGSWRVQEEVADLLTALRGG